MTFVDFGWILLFAFVAAMGLVLGRHLFGFWFSPLAVYLGMNSGSMMAYHLRLLEFNDASFTTHAILLISLACFTIGTLLALEGFPRHELNASPPVFDGRGLNKFYLVTAILASAGWILAVMILVGRHGKDDRATRGRG